MPVFPVACRFVKQDEIDDLSMSGGQYALAVLLPPIDSAGMSVAIDAALTSEVIDCVVLQRVVAPSDVQHLDVLLTVAEAQAGIPIGRTRVIAMIGDNPEGVLFCNDVRSLSARLIALAFSAPALAASIGQGSVDLPENDAMRFARSSVVLAAAAASIQAIDAADQQVTDPDIFRSRCEVSRRQGFHAVAASAEWQASIIRSVFERF